MVSQITATSQPVHAGRDERALGLAKALRDAVDAECVILFGSRARADWTGDSDIDLMIIEPEMPDLDRRNDIECIGRKIVQRMYDKLMSVDFVFLSRRDYERKSIHTLNHVSRFARREGVIIPRNPTAFPGNDAADDPYYSDEPMERELRITDANTHYQTVHDLLDLGREHRNAAYHGHQALEHAMKALISAQGHEYPHTHALDRLLGDIRANDPNLDWRPRSDLLQLNNYAGGTRYGPLLTPISDYADMANRVTDDLSRIYDEISRLTGENPWAVPPDGSDDPIQPRYR